MLCFDFRLGVYKWHVRRRKHLVGVLCSPQQAVAADTCFIKRALCIVLCMLSGAKYAQLSIQQRLPLVRPWRPLCACHQCW